MEVFAPQLLEMLLVSVQSVDVNKDGLPLSKLGANLDPKLLASYPDGQFVRQANYLANEMDVNCCCYGH